MWASVTETVCTCPYLSNSAENPDLPIQYDAEINEFSFVCPITEGEGKLTIYHCPFCGGKAPESKRDTFFAQIPMAEKLRLIEMASPLHRVEDIIAALGEPDEDNPHGVIDTFPEQEGQANIVQAYRTLRYHNLSETAEVSFMIYTDRKAAFSLSGKYKGD